MISDNTQERLINALRYWQPGIDVDVLPEEVELMRRSIASDVADALAIDNAAFDREHFIEQVTGMPARCFPATGWHVLPHTCPSGV
jgi:hypothetical protein